MHIDTDEDIYIGYEHIGKYYNGYDGTVTISEKDRIIAEKIKSMIGEGIILDLGCGDGSHTIPLLSVGVHVIAGDISNKMMGILQEKVNLLKLNLSMLMLCRINAYDIPLPDHSVNAVIANSMLHLNSNPEKIIREIYRVLKNGGTYICFDDAPGKSNTDMAFDNIKYSERLGEMHSRYFQYLKEMGIHARRYSWSFDRNAYCSNIFSDKKEELIVLPHSKITSPFTNFYNRLKGRGFSDQTAVPDDIHKKVFDRVDMEMREIYGDDYINLDYSSYQEDILMTIFIK
jgi:ubiquinone/menaquinone biosynthesis C-methylase UbiE